MIEGVDFFIMATLEIGFNRLQSAKLNYINWLLKMCFLNTHVKNWFSSKPQIPHSPQQTVQPWDQGLEEIFFLMFH